MDKVFSEKELTNIKSALEGWKDITMEQIQVTNGWGLCNKTYIVKALDPAVQPPAVFLRIFGNSLGASDYEQENKIFKEIANKGLGPKCYYANLEYRIEEYIPSQVVPMDELHTPEKSREIAKWLAGLHKQNFDFLGIPKTPTYIVNKLDSKNLVKTAKEVLHTVELNAEDKEIAEQLKKKVTEEEWSLLKEMLPKGEKTIVFSHNDPNIGNIIKKDSDGKLMPVDYENCGYNYRGLDIGFFFTLSRVNLAHPEPPYIDVNYSRFSTDEERRSWVRRYLFFFKYDWNRIDVEKALVDDEYLKEYVEKHEKLEDFEAEVEEILRESYVCAMLGQMFATVAVVNMDIKGLPYSKYEMNRASYKSYMEFKEKALAFPIKKD